MNRAQKVVVAAVVALLFGAGLALAATGRERSLAVYPPQVMPLSFDHGQHIEDGAECESCHDAARTSVRAVDMLLPGYSLNKKGKRDIHAECESCHDIEAARKSGKEVDPPAKCEVCHVGYNPKTPKDVVKVQFPAPNLLFDHKVHVDKKIECKSCHTDMLDIGLATRQHLPKMETCLICHEGTFASAACDVCHSTLPSGKLQVGFVQGVMRPTQGNPFGIDHGPRYELTHGTRAALDRKICSECHAERDCQTCHDSLQKPLAVHPNDYVLLHPVQARMDSTKCDSCHRAQSFCTACHERSGLSMDADRTLRPRNVKIHPDYQQWVEVLGPQHHAIVAARDIKQCMACHREESCMACHATSAANPASRGTNPHPSGFTPLCKSVASKNDRPCLKCHTADDLVQKGCR
ncbi:MAG: cytochrome c3 family protein [Myxococcota bacterium]